MELKTKYQYTYFIYPYVIKENKFSRYLIKLLKDKNCKLRIFQKEKDLSLYSFSLIFAYLFFCLYIKYDKTIIPINNIIVTII